MKVRATKPGVFRTRRRVGDVFDVPDDTNLGSWLEKVEDGEDRPRKKRKAEPKPPETFSEIVERDKDTLG